MYSSFIYIAALQKQVEAYTDCVHFSCTMHLQHNYISPTSVILALLCDIFQSTLREVHWWELLRGSFWSCSKHSQHMFYHYIGSCCEQKPVGEWKRFPCLELAAYRNIKIQNLYGSWEKKGFLKAAVNRAIRLWECLSGEFYVLKLHC